MTALGVTLLALLGSAHAGAPDLGFGVKHGPQYLGCFDDVPDSAGTRDLPHFVGHGNVLECAALCEGYAYFGHQSTLQCWCGHSYGRFGKSTDCECDDPEDIGGGVNCVYRIADPPPARTSGASIAKAPLAKRLLRTEHQGLTLATGAAATADGFYLFHGVATFTASGSAQLLSRAARDVRSLAALELGIRNAVTLPAGAHVEIVSLSATRSDGHPRPRNGASALVRMDFILWWPIQLATVTTTASALEDAGGANETGNETTATMTTSTSAAWRAAGGHRGFRAESRTRVVAARPPRAPPAHGLQPGGAAGDDNETSETASTTPRIRGPKAGLPGFLAKSREVAAPPPWAPPARGLQPGGAAGDDNETSETASTTPRIRGPKAGLPGFLAKSREVAAPPPWAPPARGLQPGGAAGDDNETSETASTTPRSPGRPKSVEAPGRPKSVTAELRLEADLQAFFAANAAAELPPAQGFGSVQAAGEGTEDDNETAATTPSPTSGHRGRHRGPPSWARPQALAAQAAFARGSSRGPAQYDAERALVDGLASELRLNLPRTLIESLVGVSRLVLSEVMLVQFVGYFVPA